MNFKTKSLMVLILISVFLLSSCEVYQTLYGTAPQPQVTGSVVRLEGADAKDPSNLAKTVYTASEAVLHDPFKVGSNPLGPFPKGKSLGFTLGNWLAASGIGIYSVDGENADMQLSFKKLVPNGVYTVWCSILTLPPDPKIEDAPCGAEDGSQNSFTSDSQGNGAFDLKLKPLPTSTKETASLIAIAYHSDGKTYGASPGDFGLNSHVQLFAMLPEPSGASSYQVPLKFVNHIDAGFPEQDVFVEVVEEAPVTGAVTAEEEGMEEKPSEAEVEVIETKKEEAAEMPKERPFVIVVQETDVVDLIPKAEDPDKNTNLVFTFTSPVNNKGQWQTTYGDSGEYTVTVTVSDGEATSSRDVLIIVNKKEETPAIDVAKPIESGLTIDETQSVDFSAVASDLNKDPLAYTWKLDGNDVDQDSEYTYQTDYDSAGTHTVKVDVSDSVSSASRIWSVNVIDVNRKPVLEKISDIKSKETDKIVITVEAGDDDGDSITYSISDKRFAQENNVFSWATDYDSAGDYPVTISVSDGKDATSQEFTVSVENVNRPPVIVDVLQQS